MASRFQEGQRVLAVRWPGEDRWYPGRVHHVDPANLVVVEFEEGGRAHVQAHRVRPFDWMVGSRIHCSVRRVGRRDDMATIVELDPDSLRLKVRFDDSEVVMPTFTHSCSSD